MSQWYYKAIKASWANPTKEQFTFAENNTKKSMHGFERALKENKYFAGNRITLADICWFTVVQKAFKVIFTKDFVREIPRCYEHFRHLEAMDEFQRVVKETVGASPDSVEIEWAAAPAAGGPAAPVRYHRLVTITDGKQSMKLKLYSNSQSADIQEAIRARFRLAEKERVLLVDEDDCDVVIDGTLETGNYKLVVP